MFIRQMSRARSGPKWGSEWISLTIDGAAGHMWSATGVKADAVWFKCVKADAVWFKERGGSARVVVDSLHGSLEGVGGVKTIDTH